MFENQSSNGARAMCDTAFLIGNNVDRTGA